VSVQVSRSEMRSYQRILRKAGAANKYEIAISRQALSRSTNTRVRVYAEMMVRDHDRIGRELTTLAARRGVMPADNESSSANVAELSQETGLAYDQAYVEAMIDAHEDVVALFEKASKSKDPDIAAFAVQYLPTLREHLTHAMELETLFD
jgi:putative membrane protein